MEFGAWLKELRLEQQLNGKDLAARSGVDSGTISRIELGRTDTTISTVVRLCNGLGVDFSAFFEAMRKNAVRTNNATVLRKQKSNIDISYDMLEPKDVIDLLYFFRNYPQAAIRIVAKLINVVVSLYHKQNIPVKINKVQSLQFSPLDIEDLPATMSSRVLDISYPFDISAEVLISTLARKGAMIPEDRYVFLKKLRLEENLTLAELAQALDDDGLSASTLSRLENGAIATLTITQLFKLAEFYEKGPELVEMCWQVASLLVDPRRPDPPHVWTTAMLTGDWIPEEKKLAYVFVKTYRWCQYLHGQKSWFETLWQDLENIQANRSSC